MAVFQVPIVFRETKRSSYTTPSGVVFDYSSFSFERQVGVNYRDRNSNPQWRNQVATRANASTAYVRRGLDLDAAIFDLETAGISGNTEKARAFCVSDLSLSPNVGTGTSSSLADLALSRLKRQLRNHVGSSQVLLPLAELRELRGLIGKAATFAGDLVVGLADIKRTKGRSAIRFAQDSWLNFSFGIAPTVRDIAEISSSIDKYLRRQDHFVRLTGTARTEWLSSKKSSESSWIYGADTHGIMEAIHTLSYRYIAGFSLPLGSANDYGVASHFGLEFQDLIPLAWELVPYSWIVDYFTTVGGFLDDVFTSPGGTTTYVVQNRRYTIDYSVTPVHRAWRGSEFRGTDFQGYRITKDHTTPCSARYYEFERTPLSSLPRSALRFKSVDEVASGAVNKLLNLVSLIRPKR